MQTRASYHGRPTTPFGVDSTVFVMANAERIREQYAAQRRVPGYRTLMRTSTILGTWDDHDFGMVWHACTCACAVRCVDSARVCAHHIRTPHTHATHAQNTRTRHTFSLSPITRTDMHITVQCKHTTQTHTNAHTLSHTCTLHCGRTQSLCLSHAPYTISLSLTLHPTPERRRSAIPSPRAKPSVVSRSALFIYLFIY